MSRQRKPLAGRRFAKGRQLIAAGARRRRARYREGGKPWVQHVGEEIKVKVGKTRKIKEITCLSTISHEIT